jgi:hypothetical protein
MANTETLICVGGPKDGQMLTTERWLLTFLCNTAGPPTDANPSAGPVPVLIRHTYRRILRDDGIAIWQIQSSDPTYAVVVDDDL